MSNIDNYIQDIRIKLEKALDHLQYSYAKIKDYSVKPSDLDNETLETWESFSARFARVADIFMMRYIKARVKQDDPAFDGTLRDFLNQAEKMHLIDNTIAWMKIRELRNAIAHDYAEEDLSRVLDALRQQCPNLLSIRDKI